MSLAVFTYGSLMFLEVWAPLVPRPRASVAATLPGYVRQGVSGESFPGIRPDPQGSAPGRLYLDIDDAELARLDAFEGPQYRRESVTVRLTTQDGRLLELPAEVYRIIDPAQLDGRPWDPGRFAGDAAAGFYREHSRPSGGGR